MDWIRKHTIRLVLTLGVSALLCFLAPVFVHSPAFDRAFMEWARNPNTSKEAALDAQRRETQRITLYVQLCSTALLFFTLNAVWLGIEVATRRIKPRKFE